MVTMDVQNVSMLELQEISDENIYDNDQAKSLGSDTAQIDCSRRTIWWLDRAKRRSPFDITRQCQDNNSNRLRYDASFWRQLGSYG